MYRTVILGPYPPTATKKEGSAITKGSEDIKRSTVELLKAGIKIMKSKTRCLRDISFEKGKLQLPMIVIDHTTEPSFLNLMAYERFHYGAGNNVTAYVFFLDSIIHDALDFKLLHSRAIIETNMGSDAAVKLFKSLSKNILLDKDSPLATISESLNAYCKSKISQYRVEIISSLAAVVFIAGSITPIFSISWSFTQKVKGWRSS